MTKEQIAGLVRHAFTTFGGGLVTAGVATESDLNILAGGAAVLAGIIWSWWQKRKKA